MYMVSRFENHNQLARDDADIRSHGKQSCANPRRLGFCFRVDPDSDQACRVSLELEYLEFHRERCFFFVL